MVGNVAEWVADSAPKSLTCGTVGSLFGAGQNCFAGANNDMPGTTALSRGFSGVFDVIGVRPLSAQEENLGFRAAR
jgi:hypothetical protein